MLTREEELPGEHKQDCRRRNEEKEKEQNLLQATAASPASPATVTVTPALLSMSTTITVSISSAPAASTTRAVTAILALSETAGFTKLAAAAAGADKLVWCQLTSSLAAELLEAGWVSRCQPTAVQCTLVYCAVCVVQYCVC